MANTSQRCSRGSKLRGSKIFTSAKKAIGIALLLSYALLLLAGCGVGASGVIQAASTPTVTAPRSATATPTPTPIATVKPSPTPLPTPTPTPAPTPTLPQRIIMPDIKLNAQMVTVGLERDGTMAAPNGPDVVGWFGAGPRPGQAGNVLASGHLDWAGPPARGAVFWRLKEMVPGNVVLINDAQNQYKYVVRESLRYTWDDPEALKHLAPGPEPILTLITCEGVFYTSTKNYTHRRVVVAELESSTPLDELGAGAANGR